MTLYTLKVSTHLKTFHIRVRAPSAEMAKILGRKHSSWCVTVVGEK